ncbi:MAG: hypothetical protein KMY55_10015 [Dethiosulfatibacter sp.]|nr:hypothetical protein [Dethiosulfatibacter sp.]
MPSLFTRVFPAGSYEGTKNEVELFGYSGILAASAEMPDEFLLEIMEVIQNNKDQIIGELKFVDLLGWENADKGLSDSVTREAIWNKINEKKN